MKMTRLEWRYLQKIALDHPYFDTHALPLTEKEAKAIVEANNTMTGREFVDSVYAKLGMTRPNKEKERVAWLRNIGELFTVPPIRRIAIAVLVAAMLLVFFAVTPTGRAIAESVIRYVATLLDNGDLLIKRSDLESTLVVFPKEVDSGDGIDEDDSGVNIIDTSIDSAVYRYLNTFDEFIQATGKTPVMLPLPITELYYIEGPGIGDLAINANYVTSRGKIVTFQIWSEEELLTTSSAGIKEYDGEEGVYYCVTEDGEIGVVKVFEESLFSISTKGDYRLEEIIAMLKDQ